MNERLEVAEIDSNYNEVPTGYIEMTFDEFVQKYQLEIVSREANEAIVQAEWGNGEGYDTFRVTFIH